MADFFPTVSKKTNLVLNGRVAANESVYILKYGLSSVSKLLKAARTHSR